MNSGGVGKKKEESISQAGDNKSVKPLNDFRERCMFDGSSVLVGSGLAENGEERRGEVGWRGAAPPRRLLRLCQGGHVVSLNKWNGWRCDGPDLTFTESA